MRHLQLVVIVIGFVLVQAALPNYKDNSLYGSDLNANQLAGMDSSYSDEDYDADAQCTADADDPDGDCIFGKAGDDYPALNEIPDTDFDCDDQELPGIYGDPETQCQAFHVCQEDGRMDSFLCPNGTIFNQESFVCGWWYEVDCSATVELYSRNADLYADPSKYGYKLVDERNELYPEAPAMKKIYPTDWTLKVSPKMKPQPKLTYSQVEKSSQAFGSDILSSSEEEELEATSEVIGSSTSTYSMQDSNIETQTEFLEDTTFFFRRIYK